MLTSSDHSEIMVCIAEGFDTEELTTVTASMDIGSRFHIGLFVHENSGSHTTHEITIQVSNDDINWFDSDLLVAGLGSVEGTTVASYIRAKVTKVQALSSLVNLELVSK